MDLGTVLSVAQTLFAALQCSELRELCSVLGYKSELESLERTVNTVKAVLLDADSKEVQGDLSHQAQLYIDQLKDAVYDADDVLDEFVTLAQQKKLIKKGGKVSERVRLLFSRFNPLSRAHKMSQGVKEIRKRLDAIASDHNKYGFKLDCQPTRRRREESCSYVYAQHIIGRDEDKENIVGRLLDPNVQHDISCLTIVGIGGLGKTALAQLIYNDTRIIESFPLMLWTCVSDQDPENLDVKDAMCKILHSATGENLERLSMELLQKKLQEQLAGKKYFMVLDDVWNENRLQWLKLVKFLRSGLRGSWIVVTTRSENTVTAVGDEHAYRLKGLSKDDSWRLFEMTAFGERHDKPPHPDLVEIGRGIVKKCANVPLAIRVVGTLLYDQGKEKWIFFQKMGLGGIKQGKDGGIEPILKLSYHYLEAPLKTCFSYCALFPKDYVIEKEKLISLWMAQDYVETLEGQSIEDAGEEYFSILVKRCFFQDVEKDEFGEIVSCKIHDLMHDIAQEVAGKAICRKDSNSTSLDNKIRHLSYVSADGATELPFAQAKIRTCLHLNLWTRCIAVDTLLRNSMCLRTLDLSDSGINSLPSSVGELLHLRYLDLSINDELELLPYSISKLHNLQTLRLALCVKLIKLPKDLSKLVKLRVLDIGYCLSLNSMPRGIGKLRCLHKLPMFIVGDGDSTSKQGVVYQMEELKALTNIKGSLEIKILENAEYDRKNVQEGGYIRNKEHLNCVHIEFPYSMSSENEGCLILEDLQPHSNLRELKLNCCKGIRMPSWAREDNLATFLPNLVKLELRGCQGLQHLPSLRKLRNMKSLIVCYLDDLEYIENTTSKGIEASISEPLFPFLKQLTLTGLPKLKGWWRDDEIIDCDTHIKEGHHLLTSFPCLSKLNILNCPNLTCVITSPNVEELDLSGKLNEKLKIMIPTESGNAKLRRVSIADTGILKSMSIEAFQCLQEMKIEDVAEMESLSEIKEVFLSCSSSLKSLTITQCRKLKSLSGGLEHLTALETLELNYLDCLNMSNSGEGNEDDGIPWRGLQHRLCSLELDYLPKLVNLPKGMRYLTALEVIKIRDCKQLESLPEWMPELTSLRTLYIAKCFDGLRERCQRGTGEDWPNIQHIRGVLII